MSDDYEVQYGLEKALVYDEMMGGSISARRTARRIVRHIRGKRVIDIGTGNARVAKIMCEYANSVVGIDNSQVMLDRAQEGEVPKNLELLRADFREPLPVRGAFDTAICTTGSLACVKTPAELVLALSNIRAVLKNDGSLSIEYYSRKSCENFAASGVIDFISPVGNVNGSTSAYFSSGDLFTTTTEALTADGQRVQFSETVYLPQLDHLTALISHAGFTITESYVAHNGAAFDRFLLTR